nr:UDP-N-acetylmuramoyl-tripeptide--D-alanyl-D-alanine ligase [Paenibacillus ginsengarvi]
MIRKFGEIAEMVTGTAVGGEAAMLVRGVSKDTRTIEAGNLYVPIIGERFDGHDYAKEAYDRGASATLWQRDRGEPPAGVPAIIVDDTLAALQQLAARYREQLPVRIIGVTGSNGKTTTKDMIAAVLAESYNVFKTEGNLNGDIGLPLMILRMDESTELAVLEMGMRGFGEIELLTQIARPEVAVITMIGEAHLERLGSREGIARAKLEIAAGLRSGGVLVYNGDEPLIEKLLPAAAKPDSMSCVRFGTSDQNDLQLGRVGIEADGSSFTVGSSQEPVYHIPLLGRHNAVNALAAIAVGRHFDLTPEAIASGLRKAQPTGMRIEKLQAPTGLTVLNDAYNASPASTRASLELLGELTGYGRKIVVLGDMLELGGEEEQFHWEIGEFLTPDRYDYVFAYGPLSVHMAEAARLSFPPERVRWFADKEELAQEVASVAAPEDIVLVKGSRGMRLEEVVHKLMTLQL